MRETGAVVPSGPGLCLTGEGPIGCTGTFVGVGSLELYGRTVEVSFVGRIRGMVRFDGIDALVAAMHDDVARTRVVLGLR